MILLFGGTTEGKQAAGVLDELKLPHIYSTKTASAFTPTSPFAQVHQGALDEEGLKSYSKTEGVRLIIDAAHPFAEELHRTVHKVSQELEIPVIRFEREIPEKREESFVHYLSGYDAALNFLEEEGIEKLYALTGVQSISTLRPYWEKHEAWFRILPRQASEEEAEKAGFPSDRLIRAYPSKDVEEEVSWIRQHSIEALLTKESGGPGQFDVKLEAARRTGTPLLVIERPSLPESFIVCHNEEQLEQELKKSAKARGILRSGYTTGTCAAAATKAALLLLLKEERPDRVSIEVPSGGAARVPVESLDKTGNAAEAWVIKDGGDDPDATHGARIGSRVTPKDTGGICLHGGEGVGEVTLEGMGLPLGEPAINPVPRRCIEAVTRELLEEARSSQGMDVTIAVEDGEKIAKKTLNERVGIKGGISILGTTGIVTPYSKASYIASIQQGIEIATRAGCRELALNAGGRSEKYLQAELPHLPEQAFIQYGNWIGETLEMIDSKEEVKRVHLGIMLGKAVKLAEGYLDTSSRTGSMNVEFLAELAKKTHPSDEALYQKLERLSMAGKLTELFSFDPDEPFYQELAQACIRTCRKQLSPEKELNLGLIEKEGRVVWVRG